MEYLRKVIAGCAILLVIIIAGGIFMLKGLESSSRDMSGNIASVIDSLDAGNWQGTYTGLESFERKWTAAKKSWTTVIDHSEIDNIDISLRRLKQYVKSGNRTLSAGEAAVLKQYIGHIPEKDAFRLQNIL